MGLASTTAGVKAWGSESLLDGNNTGVTEYLNLSSENNGDDEPVDGDSLTEDDTDEVLSLDPGSLDSPSDDADPSGVDAQGGPNHGEGDTETHSYQGPHVGRGLGEEPANVYPLPPACQEVVKGQQGQEKGQQGPHSPRVHLPIAVARVGNSLTGHHNEESEEINKIQ